MLLRVLTSLFSLLLTLPAFSFFSLMDTGHVTKQGEYRILGESQILMDAPEGFNLNSRFSTGLDEESEIQFEAGVGSVDYYLGAFWKWAPFPDTDSQPAIGGRFGLVFADFNGLSTYGFNVTPFVSKTIDSDHGAFTPYGGLQIGLLNNVNETLFSMQAVLGLEWKPNRWDFPELEDFQFLLEYGHEVDDAFGYFSFAASYDF